MISYVIRYKKLTDKTTNNHRKMHGEPMKRWVQLFRVRDYINTYYDRKRRIRTEVTNNCV